MPYTGILFPYYEFNKTAAILNIMGWAIAYIVFATIYAQVDFANKFDRSIHKWIIFTG